MAKGDLPEGYDPDKIKKARREAIRRQAQQRYDSAINREAGQRRQDDQELSEIRNLLGGDLDDIADALAGHRDLADELDKVQEVKKALRKGNTGKARRLAKRHQGKIQKAAKEAEDRDDGWCAVWALLLLLIGGLIVAGAGWGAVELASAVLP